MRMAGCMIPEIAAMLGVSEKTIHVALWPQRELPGWSRGGRRNRSPAGSLPSPARFDPVETTPRAEFQGRV
jgi:hypothetical protein